MGEELTLEDILALAQRMVNEGRCGSIDIHSGYANMSIDGQEYSISIFHSYSGPKYTIQVDMGSICLFKRGYIKYIDDSHPGYEIAEQIGKLFREKANEENQRKCEEQERIRESSIRDLKKGLRD